MRRLLALLIVTMLVAGVTARAAADAQPAPWPQFRGPQGGGVVDDADPPTNVGPETNVRWKIATPAGASSPIVVGDLVVLTGVLDKQLSTIAYRRSDGSEAWRAQVPCEKFELHHPTEGSLAASTPATDGERIVCYFGSCGLLCYDLAGRELWRHELPPAVTLADFGTGVSPLLIDGLAILLRDEKNDPKLIALDAATGQVKWERKRESISGFGTPAVWEIPAGKQIVAPGYGRMIGYDLPTGQEKWFVNGMPAASCTTPVVADGTLYYAGWSPGDTSEKDGFKLPEFEQLLQLGDKDKDGVFSKEESESTMFKGFFDNNDPNKDGRIERAEWDQMLAFMANAKNSAFSLRAGGDGDVSESHVNWKQTDGLPYVPSAICYRGQFTMVKDGGIVTSYDAQTGEQLYKKRAVAAGNYYASPVAAKGRIYFVSLNEGIVTVLQAGEKKPTVIAKNKALDERVFATPALVDDVMYLRTAEHLYAFGRP